jgi:Peptidase A4 family
MGKQRALITAGLLNIGILMLMLVAPAAQANTLKSYAWAGYQANHNTFRYVAAHWHVPTLSCPGTGASGDSDSYSWVGFGPGPSNSERVGVRALCTGMQPTWVAYIEMNGLYEARGIEPHAGDMIFANVYYASGKYRFSLTDSTLSTSFSQRYSCGAFSSGQGTCSRSTAEVITGILVRGRSPLADYGKVMFQNVMITDAIGQRGSFATNPHWKITRFTEYHATILAATASPLTSGGTTFTDTWHHL